MQNLHLNVQCVPDVNDKTISNVSFDKTLHNGVCIINWYNFDICCYIVLSCKINHLLGLLHSSNGTTSYYLSP
ncbi:mannitol dehydrogenase [Pyrus ussuriensis x Pyrus communis]|uniref:Mannitol dehydrogenase n=1 Tax=Pyrus ussuriensis x Pyrus communis TaxID=2448454 RepID=A0A5N5H6L9_9ROSA|nr:mannitol dehydrogenase [Pyrus ussuriensis x Pyrus communis]